jgi:hypothetical protein
MTFSIPFPNFHKTKRGFYPLKPAVEMRLTKIEEFKEQDYQLFK